MTNRKCITHVFVSNILSSPSAIFLACRTRCMIGNIKMFMIAIQILTFEGERLLKNMLSHHGIPTTVTPEKSTGSQRDAKSHWSSMLPVATFRFHHLLANHRLPTIVSRVTPSLAKCSKPCHRTKKAMESRTDAANK